ncbi:hypothetical protein ACIQF6_09025 [Kitasatospora sp. NPDC092948]|uniref:hypothetical protein n=1 Tax=Kitasatospora sp. NPDC092948 TaxID=3364088 RepID=UPI0037F822A2
MARLHSGLRLNTAAWEGVTLTPSNNRMRKILDEIGPAGLGRSVTIHEAGHAVVGLATGHRITGMQLTGNGLNHGQTQFAGANAVPLTEHVAMTTAGVQACTRWLRGIGASRHVMDYATDQAAADMDFIKRTVRAEGANPSAVLRDAQKIADRFLDRYWSQVEAVAYELDLRNSLGESAIRSLARI